MEGVPRISMLSFPLRRSADTPSFKQKLKPFIRSMYGEDPDSYSHEVNTLESLRAGAVHVTKDLGGVATLKKYYAQLHFLKSRFPLHDGQPCALSFSWYDAFSESVHGWTDIDYEMACVLYNIGALHTELGATDNRQTADGMKSACTHFQCAAWAFSHLRSHYIQFLSPDVGPETLSLMTAVSLAQAQECILEKSLIDSRKSSITAKVALQIVDYYDSALRSTDAILKDSSSHSSALAKALKKYKKTLDVKVAYYLCLSLLYRGMQAEDDSKWGYRVAYYKSSYEKLTDALKSAKALEKGDPIHETLTFTLDVVGGKVSIAEKDNEFIYHDKVPETGVVEKEDGLKGVSLVKGIPFKVDDIGVSGGDIFARLVPIEAHEAASLYSEEKAKLLRNYTARIQEKDETLAQFCTALQLDALDLEGGPKIIPQELVDCCAGISVNKDAVKRLSELMSTLSSLYHDVDGNLEEVNRLLAQEDDRGSGGGKQSNVLKELSREAAKYGGCHKVAGETNEALGESLRRHVGNLQILMKPLNEVVREHIPGGHATSSAEQEVVDRMKKLVGKVKEMKEQRINLEKQLRESLLGDDITKRLVVVAGGEEELESVFAEEMKKHEGLTAILDKNLSAQENIIRALTEANAAYADERRAHEECVRRRAEVIEDLIASYEAYDDLLGKLNKGVEFYTKLDVNVGKLLNRLRATLKVEEDAREAVAFKKGAFISSTPATITGTGVSPAGGVGLADPGLSPPSTLSMTIPPSAGTGLKLKDYLAMKKAGGVAGTVDGPTVPVKHQPQQLNEEQLAYQSHQAPQSEMQHSQQNHMQGYFPQSMYNGTTNAAYSVPAYSSMPFHTSTTTFPSSYSNTSPAATGPNPITYNPYGNGGVGPSVPQGVAAPVSYATASSFMSSGTGTTLSSGSEYGNHSFLAQYVQQQGYTSNSTQNPPQANQQWPFLASAYGQFEAQRTQAPQQQQHWTPQEVTQPLSQQQHLNTQQNLNTQQHLPQQPHLTPQQQHFPQQPHLNTEQHLHQQPHLTPQQQHLAQQQHLTPQQQHVPQQQHLTPQQQHVPQQQHLSTEQHLHQQQHLNSQQHMPQQQHLTPQQQHLPQQQNFSHHQTSPICVSYGGGVNHSQGSQQVDSATKLNPVEYEPRTNFDLLSSLDMTDVPVQPLTPTPIHPPPQQQESAVMVVIKAPPSPEATTAVSNVDVSHSACTMLDAKMKRPVLPESRQIKNVDLEQLLADTLKLEGIVDTYLSEERWASVVSLQNCLCASKRVSVGRMYAMKNRAPDILPFDEDRVPLPLTSDDYINASFLRPLSLPLIATQAPILLPSCSTVPDFFSMLWTNGVETWVTLVPNHDLGEHVYWPQEKGSTLLLGSLAVTLLAVNSRGTVTERTFSLKNSNSSASRILIQLQLTSWGGHGLPSDPQGLIEFVKEVREYFVLQRTISHPLVVHCIHGVGKTGLFSILISAVNDVLQGRPLPDLVQLGGGASACRKGLLVDKEHLKFAHSTLLLFCRSELLKNGVKMLHEQPTLTEKDERRKSVADILENSDSRKTVDPLSLLDPLWSLNK